MEFHPWLLNKEFQKAARAAAIYEFEDDDGIKILIKNVKSMCTQARNIQLIYRDGTKSAWVSADQKSQEWIRSIVHEEWGLNG